LHRSAFASSQREHFYTWLRKMDLIWNVTRPEVRAKNWYSRRNQQYGQQ